MDLLNLYMKALKEVFGKVDVILTYVAEQYYVSINHSMPDNKPRFNTVDITLERALHRSARMFLSSTNSKSAWTQLNELIHKGP